MTQEELEAKAKAIAKKAIEDVFGPLADDPRFAAFVTDAYSRAYVVAYKCLSEED